MKVLLAPRRSADGRVTPLRRACMVVLAQLVLGTGVSAQPTSADMQSVQREIDALRAAQAAMREELQEIKALLQKQGSPAPAAGTAPAVGTELSLRVAQIKGASQASVVVVEFSDFQCPFCARHATSTYREIVREYVDTGKVRYAFMHFPIESLHPRAFREHVAAACAADQGRFWEMHGRLFATQRTPGVDALGSHATAIGLDAARFRSCLASERRAADVRGAMSIGSALGITGTPTFLIGIMERDDKFRTMTVIAGAKPYPVFRDAIETVLSTAALSKGASLPARSAVTPRVGSAAEATR